MIKAKEVWRKEANIKIRTLLEVTENPKGHFTNKEKLINIQIQKYMRISSASFIYNKKGKKELLKMIKEELNL